jgi:hypothetical protein
MLFNVGCGYFTVFHEPFTLSFIAIKTLKRRITVVYVNFTVFPGDNLR